MSALWKNDSDGDQIWNCCDCGCVHCKDCDGEFEHCPSCQSANLELVGNIEVGSSREDEPDEDDVFSACPRCGKNDDGDTIWKCSKCGCVHCRDCDVTNERCPACGSAKLKQIGHIDNE